MRLRILLALALIGLMFYSPNTSAQTYPDTLVYAMPYDFSERSIFTQQSYATAQWMSAIFVGLYARDQFNQRDYSPVLADGDPVVQLNGTDFVDNSTAMRITVTLKSGLKFADGNPLTIDDVIYTYKMLLMPDVDILGYGTWTYYFKDNNSIVKVDDNTVRFDVQVFYFQYYSFITAAILPQEVYQPAIDGGTYDFETDYETFLIGAGPFMLDSFDVTNSVITVVKNPNWVGSEQRVDKIVFKKIATKEAAIGDLADGNIHILDSQYVPQKDDLTGYDNVKEEFVSDPSWQEMSYNHIHPVYGDTAQQDAFIGKTYDYGGGNSYTITSYWKDQGVNDEATRREKAGLVRQAMDTIIPRQTIVDEILQGIGSKAATIWPNVAIGYDPTITPRTYDVDAARSLMEQAGFDFNTLTYDSANDVYTTYFFSITILAPDTNVNRNQWAELMRNQLPKIGIGVKDFVNEGWGVVAPRTFGYAVTSADMPIPLYDQGGYDLMFIGYSSGLDFDAYGLYETYMWIGKGGFNWYNWYDPDYDTLSETYGNTLDFDARVNIAHQIQQYYFDHLIVSAIIYPVSHWGFNKDVTGYDPVLLSTTSQQWEYVGFGEFNTGTTATTTETTQGGFLAFGSSLFLFMAAALVAVPIIRKRN